MSIANDNLIALMQSPKIENKLIAFEMIRNTQFEAAFELSKQIANIKAEELAKEFGIHPNDMAKRAVDLYQTTGIFPHLVFDNFKGPMLLRHDLFDAFMQMRLYNPIPFS